MAVTTKVVRPSTAHPALAHIRSVGGLKLNISIALDFEPTRATTRPAPFPPACRDARILALPAESPCSPACFHGECATKAIFFQSMATSGQHPPLVNGTSGYDLAVAPGVASRTCNERPFPLSKGVLLPVVRINLMFLQQDQIRADDVAMAWGGSAWNCTDVVFPSPRGRRVEFAASARSAVCNACPCLHHTSVPPVHSVVQHFQQ